MSQKNNMQGYSFLEKILSWKSTGKYKVLTILGCQKKFVSQKRISKILLNGVSKIQNEILETKVLANQNEILGLCKNISLSMNKLTNKRRMEWQGIVDSSPSSFKDFILNNSMPEIIKDLKANLDEKSLQIIDRTLKKIVQLPDYTYSKYLYVDDNEFRNRFETEDDKAFNALHDKYFMVARTKYKLSKDDYDMEVFVYHHGLNFAPEKIKKYVKGKDFVDAGAYVGDSALVFMDYSPHKIYSFEISETSIQNYQKTMELNSIEKDKWQLVKAALSDKKGTVTVADDGGMSVKVYNSKGDTVEATDLDAYLADKNVNIGFIKADLEGGMYKALIGMEKTIKKYRPVLSFAIYHSPEEFFYTKPLLDKITKDLNYKITIDCHFSSCFHIYGTVIWAYPRELEEN